MTVQSSIPAVLTSFLSLCSTAVAGQTSQAGAPVPVVEGEVGTYVADEFVQVIGVSGIEAWGSLGAKRRVEDYDIACKVRAYTGNEDQAYCVTRVFALMELIRTALNADLSLGGLITPGYLEITTLDVLMGVTDEGGRASELDFKVTVHNEIH